jgi:hypothetical protein
MELGERVFVVASALEPPMEQVDTCATKYKAARQKVPNGATDTHLLHEEIFAAYRRCLGPMLTRQTSFKAAQDRAQAIVDQLEASARYAPRGMPVASSPSPAATPDPTAALLARLQKVEAFMQGQPYVVDRRLSAVRALGRVLKEEVSRGPYPADPAVTMERRTLQFDGLRLEGFTKDTAFMVCIADYTKAGWAVSPSLGVGADVTQVDAALGPPAQTESNVLVYRPVANGDVRFHVMNGRVSRIEFNFGCD